jgi:hypothetical protein
MGVEAADTYLTLCRTGCVRPVDAFPRRLEIALTATAESNGRREKEQGDTDEDSNRVAHDGVDVDPGRSACLRSAVTSLTAHAGVAARTGASES